MSITSNMFMYSLTLRPAGMITKAIVGNFIPGSTREQQILVASGERLTLNVVARKTGRFQTLLSHNVFGIIRNISACRIPGTPQDIIIVATDSGRITLLKYNHERNRFERVHLETFGKSGIRRTIPGQYLATDPRGRCTMFASVEKNKVVYILNRNQEQEITISSPHEVNKGQTLTFALCAVDSAFDHPTFAALEVDYTDIDQDPSDISYEERQKMLVYYRVDLGINHVVRAWTDPVDYTSNLLFPLPGGVDGPSGVVVCALENIQYRSPDHQPLRIPIPRRRGATEDPNRKRRIVCGQTHKVKGEFFVLLQTDDGDLFVLRMLMQQDEQGRKTGQINGMELRYMDTLPIANSFVILKSGFLFLATENGDSYVYRFLSLGDQAEPVWTSDAFPTEGGALVEEYQPQYFKPHKLENFAEFHTVPSLNPQKKTLVEDVENKDDWKIYTTSGTGQRSAFSIMSHGLPVVEHAETEIPGVPSGVWAVPTSVNDEFDKYMVLSFTGATMFLSIGEQTEVIHDHGLREDVQTLHIGGMGDYGIIQVWDRGFRYWHDASDRNADADWSCPAYRTIVKATSNRRQLCLALSSGELLYFEVSPNGFKIQEYDQGSSPATVSGVVQAMSMGPVPEGRVRTPFMVLGTDDSTIRVLSVDPDNMLETQSIQSLTAPPKSIEVLPMEDSTGYTTFVHVGLYSGVYLRAVLDDINGELGDVRSRFLGAEEAKLMPVRVNGQNAMLCCGARTFLSYPHPETKELLLTPLDYHAFGSASAMRVSLEGQADAIVGVRGQMLNVFSIGETASNITTRTIPLQHTARGFARHPDHRFFTVIETDANTLSKVTRENQLNNPNLPIPAEDRFFLGPSNEFSWPRANGHWASCIEVIDPTESGRKAIKYTVHLEDNEAALCCDMVPFESQDGENFLLVGTGKNMVTGPPTPNNPTKTSGFVHVYRVVESNNSPGLNPGEELEFIHKTEYDKPIFALMPFQGRVALGVGNELFVYDLGLKALLRKSRVRTPGVQIISLATQGSRIVVGDMQESVSYVVYKHSENKLIPFVDDSVARWTTAMTMLDYDTVAGGDKFGNIWIVRCPKAVSEESDEPGAGNFLANEKGYLGGTPNRLELLVHNFVQDVPTSVQKTALVPGGQEVLFWAGLQGTLGVFVPFVDREDVEFFSSLEGHLRAEDPPLCGRDHLMYRSYYIPVKGCVDGDLCERYFVLKREQKERIAGDLDRSVREVEKKIAEMRTRVAF